MQLVQPNSKGLIALCQKLVGERDFYGFLAADRLGVPYKFGNRPAHIDPRVLQRIRNTASTRRAMESFNRGEVINARRKWYHAARLLSRDELIAQARLAYDMQWYLPAICSISQAQYWDDPDIRFPMVHHATLMREARNRDLHSSWIFAITRQESAFTSDARSGTGATGLAQLVPDATKEASRKFGILLASTRQLIMPDASIRPDAVYLSQVHGQFSGDRVPALAAYNAGPGHVRQWLRDTHCLASDVWTETIPFDKTRQYVQSVLSYAVIYLSSVHTSELTRPS